MGVSGAEEDGMGGDAQRSQTSTYMMGNFWDVMYSW